MHSTPCSKNKEKIFKNKFTNMTPLQFLQFIRLRKSKRNNFMFSSKRIQILTILFQVDCAINQFCKFLLPSLAKYRGAGRSEGQGGGGSFSNSFSNHTAFSMLYVPSLPPALQTYCQTIKHFTKTRVLNTSHKH